MSNRNLTQCVGKNGGKNQISRRICLETLILVPDDTCGIVRETSMLHDLHNLCINQCECYLLPYKLVPSVLGGGYTFLEW